MDIPFDTAFLERHYNSRNEDERLTTRHGLVEYLTTMRYIEKYLFPGAKIIEIGAGTGRYSLALAAMGFDVEAVELVEHNIEVFREKITAEQRINVTQGNALDLSAFKDNSFDLTLLLGPMYHLYTDDDKHRAISEALRVTKPGGVVFAAYCISDGSLLSAFQRNQFDIVEYVNRGKIDPVTFATTSVPEDVFELVRKEDIDRIMSGFDSERLHYVATDLFARYISDELNEMDEAAFALFMRYHYAICERADIVGVSHHVVDVFKKHHPR
jgi:ubiquinone/menaquinone biosynthesis C-methylase UbiE